MASSRNSTPLNKSAAKVEATFKRALEAIPARVVVSGQPAPRPRIALAYSGGLDSSVLLHLAATHCRESGIELHAFHVHHGLSPNADQWLAHCRNQAEALGVRFDAREVAVHDIADHGTEQAARLARYEALAAMCKQHQVTLLLTAHHQDDQAETVLLQLFRGAGLRGLGGMAVLHVDHELLGEGITVLRPLLACSRTELEDYVRKHAIVYIDDESNVDTRYRRNAIRQRIAPAIEEHFPGFAATVSRSARHLQSARRLLDELAEMDRAACAQGGALVVDKLRQLSSDRTDNLLRYWLQRHGASQLPSEAQLAQLRNQMLGAQPDAHPLLDIAGLTILRERGLISTVPSFLVGEPPSGEVLVEWRGEREIMIPSWHGSLSLAPCVGLGIDPVLLSEQPIRIVARAGSERLKLDARRPSRTLKNLFQEAGLPARTRPWLPLVYVGDQLAYAAGLGIDARFATCAGGIRLAWHLSPSGVSI